MWKDRAQLMLETSIKMNGPTDGVQEVYRTWTAPEYSSSIWGRRHLTGAWGYCSVTLVIKIIGQLSLFFIICSKFSIYNLTIHICFPWKWGNVMIILLYGTGSIPWSLPKSLGEVSGSERLRSQWGGQLLLLSLFCYRRTFRIKIGSQFALRSIPIINEIAVKQKL